jgi:hypothetical protein
MAQDIMEDAELAFDDLKRRHPDHPMVIALGDELAPMRAPLEQEEDASRPLVEFEDEDVPPAPPSPNRQQSPRPVRTSRTPTRPRSSISERHTSRWAS